MSGNAFGFVIGQLIGGVIGAAIGGVVLMLIFRFILKRRVAFGPLFVAILIAYVITFVLGFVAGLTGLAGPTGTGAIVWVIGIGGFLLQAYLISQRVVDDEAEPISFGTAIGAMLIQLLIMGGLALLILLAAGAL